MKITVESFDPDLFTKTHTLAGNFRAARRVVRFQASIDWPKIDIQILSHDVDLRGVDLRDLLSAVTEWVKKNGKF